MQAYHDSKPPFVCKSSAATEGAQRAVFVTKNGQRPLVPIHANLVRRSWGPPGSGSKWTFWTLDLDGERLIVQSFRNRGSISSAKWVYCCWTGVGDDFEDRPVAFTCINGEYTSVPVRVGAKRLTSKNHTLNSTAANATPLPGNHHIGIATPLPENHPVEHLDEAEELYLDSRPPFAVHRSRRPRREDFLATQDGQFSATSSMTDVIYRAWDSQDDCT